MSIVINRTGICVGCGYCCGYVDGKITEGSCRHLSAEGKCSIYERRGEYCEECKQIHDTCVTGPELPTGNPECGYRFIVEGSGAEVLKITFRR